MGILLGLLLLNLQGVRYLPVEEDSKPEQVAVKEKPKTVKEDTREKTDKLVELEKTVARLKKSVTRAAEKLPKPAPAPEPAPPAVQCDREDATEVWAKAEKLATIVDNGGRLQLHLKREWEYYGPGHRRGFIEAFSDAALCLKGHHRPILFVFRGDEVASVSADGLVEIK
jgi:hypothetical protein